MFLLRLFFTVAGILLIADGVGSIIVQASQPVWPWHILRTLRAALGAALIYAAGWLT